MIPLKLEIKNFLSYGPNLQTINFGPYPLICLSGKNGHGKSALLDAMTWAIWGEARKSSGTAKADAQLLHLGQTQMMVCFEFSFNNQHYKIKREYAKTYGKPLATLEFAIIDPLNKELKTLTDKTIRATQDKIEATIGLHYDAFINSAFLKQGQSNEFSKKSPKERKEIIAHILGLDHYEKLRKSSMEKIKELSTRQAVLTQQHASMVQELEKKPILLEQLNTIQQSIETVDKEFNVLEELHKNLQAKKELLANEEKNEALHKQQIFTTHEQHKKAHDKLKELILNWRTQHRMLKAIGNKLVIEQELQTLKINLKNHQELLAKQWALKEKIITCKEQHQHALQIFKENFRKKIQELELKKTTLEKDKAGIISECQQVLKQLKEHGLRYRELTLEIANEEKKLPKNIINAEVLLKNELLFEKRKSHYHAWIAQANALQKESGQLEQKMKFTHDVEQPSCPLCEQNLSASRKKFLQQKFSQESGQANHQLKRFKRIIAALKEILITQHKEIADQKKIQEQTLILINRIQNLRDNAHQINELNARLDKEQQNLLTQRDALEKDIQIMQAALVALHNQELEEIANDPTLTTITHELSAHENALKKNNYTPEAHQKDESRKELLEKHLEACHKEHEERVVKLEREKEIATLSSERKKIRTLFNELQHSAKKFEHLEKDRLDLTNEERNLAQSHKEISQKKDILQQEKGRIEAEQAHLKKVEERAHNFLNDTQKVTQEMYDYEIIAQALSKDGIQALLIEQALPEIEHEANQLLAQLTDNQSHIIIDSLRDLKKGGTKETLDIKISDAVGIRPYELFSGGEAFRIDFALRIAISKLLARRAGTSLQTLIIDEGFGSQDDDGLNHIMDALLKIQEHFSKIIIVSHLPSMKDQFPVHFHIEKFAQGSVVSIIQQG